MTTPPDPINYQHPPARPPTSQNFMLALLAGVAASACGWGIAWAVGSAAAVEVVLVTLLVGKLGIAILAGLSGKRPGTAQGLLLSILVVLLLAGGLCFAVVAGLGRH